MSKSTYTASFGSSEDKIWSLITGQQDGTWRTDLLRSEEGEKKHSFVEYYKNGDVVNRQVSMTIPHQRYECSIEGCGYEGKRVFSLTKKNSRTILSIEDEISRAKGKTVKKPVLRVQIGIIFGKAYLKCRQKKYVKDLYRALKEKS